ncbi:DNA polymerase delta subunit 2 [Platysternon megacephalum]|uniref:DNA polymerase delta subunit 2 n=1 Tax=Platysternon megacephalum TaxID=55544 RepID=A0A4D9DZA3_9SAUR|nr:DNA polymerase delta subunit 2 [Platysternon megacephalum]
MPWAGSDALRPSHQDAELAQGLCELHVLCTGGSMLFSPERGRDLLMSASAAGAQLGLDPAPPPASREQPRCWKPGAVVRWRKAAADSCCEVASEAGCAGDSERL